MINTETLKPSLQGKLCPDVSGEGGSSEVAEVA